MDNTLFRDSPSSILEKLSKKWNRSLVITEDNQIFYSSGLTLKLES